MKLVWDYRDGFVVDAETGVVVDRIYDYSPPPRYEQEIAAEIERQRLVERRKPRRLRRDRRRRWYSIVFRMEQRTGATIDYTRVSGNSSVRSMYRQSTLETINNIRGDPETVRLIAIGRCVVPEYLASGLPWRTALLMFYLAGYYMVYGSMPDDFEIYARFCVSEGTVRRLIEKLRRHGLLG